MGDCYQFGTSIYNQHANSQKFLGLGFETINTGHELLPLHSFWCVNTPHELVYGIKPDLRVLFCLFSTGHFWKTKDGTNHRSGISTSTSMQGIALGRCKKTDRMIFYSPHSKESYISSDYKLDEGWHTPTAFNLQYDE
jgi:hypothetical protein